jgi:hypothetical protein
MEDDKNIIKNDIDNFFSIIKDNLEKELKKDVNWDGTLFFTYYPFHDKNLFKDAYETEFFTNDYILKDKWCQTQALSQIFVYYPRID